MDVRFATDPVSWDAFLLSQQFRPFLQSWSMGEVYRDIGQEPLRLEVRESDRTIGICAAHIVPARRGRHLSVPYGPVVASAQALPPLLSALEEMARTHRCAFVRFSPFWPSSSPLSEEVLPSTIASPLHLLAEHLWYLPLQSSDPWDPMLGPREERTDTRKSEEELLAGMRSTARNLIRRAQKEGVTVTRSDDPVADLTHFLALHEETRKRHHFTPYSTSFFRAQVSTFAPQGNVALYLAHYKGEVISASIHMLFGGETSYHHGASTLKYRNIPSNYLLQWTAIRDALSRGDGIYNFWGISPEGVTRHPFSGVRTFKTAFGGTLLELTHCRDLPLSPLYRLTRAVETWRKWRRGF